MKNKFLVLVFLIGLFLTSFVYIIINKNTYTVYNGNKVNKNIPIDEYYIVDDSYSIPSNSFIDCKEITDIKKTELLRFGYYIGENKHNITIKNCVIDINKGYQEANFGIFIFSPKNNTSNIKLINNTIIIKDGFIVRGIEVFGGHNILIKDNLINVRGNRTYGIRTQADNNNININNNIITAELIPGGLFINPIEPSNWINKFVYNTSIKNNKINCISDKEMHALVIADTKNSEIKHNIINNCLPLWTIRSSNNEIWNNTFGKLK